MWIENHEKPRLRDGRPRPTARTELGPAPENSLGIILGRFRYELQVAGAQQLAEADSAGCRVGSGSLPACMGYREVDLAAP